MLDIEFPKKLAFLINEPAMYKIIYGGRYGLKCLAIGTKVIMYDGTLKVVEDVKENDLLMGPDSEPRKVYGTVRGQSQMYKIKQTSGIDYVVNSAHILSLKKRSPSYSDFRFQKSGNPRSPGGRYPNYPEITNINVVEAFNKSARWIDHFRGYRAGLIEFQEQAVAIDPWFLGAWLGDGRSNDVTIYSGDKEILDACENYADKLGMRIAIYEEKSKCIGIAIRKNIGELKSQLWEYFRLYNLFDNKHIPQEYISNSEEIRLNVLAGLIDTDGTVHNNGYGIYQVNEKLAKDIKYLASTLGFRTNITKQKTKCFYKGQEIIGEAWRVYIGGDIWKIPCKLPRKQIKEEKKRKDFLLSQIEIEPIGIGEYAGFSIDGDHLFLLEDGTVTHNTETVSRALLILTSKRKLRVVCFRELQNSIDESVYQTLKNCIYDLCLEDEFDIQAKTIISLRTGSEFIFKGLRYNIDSIKSLARIDIAWIEEANNVSKTSWDKLEPTIRGKHDDDPNGMGGPFGLGPEIWATFNPELDTDETYIRFIARREELYPDYAIDEKTGKRVRYCIAVKTSYKDNKWLPVDARLKIQISKANAEKTNNWSDYLHIYEGQTKQVLEGAIYVDEIKKVMLEERRGKVPYNPAKPVYTFWDLGHSNHTSIWFIQHSGVEYNIINFYQNRLKKIPHYLEYLQSLQYNYGCHYLPHDADNETLSSEMSIDKQVRLAYPGKVKIVPRVSKKIHAINAVKTVFDLCNFDEINTSEGWQCLCRYAYKVDENGKFSNDPDHNEYSDGADSFATFAQSLKPEQEQKKPRIVGAKVLKMNVANEWMGA